jgi:hypothetical protein
LQQRRRVNTYADPDGAAESRVPDVKESARQARHSIQHRASHGGVVGEFQQPKQRASGLDAAVRARERRVKAQIRTRGGSHSQ